MNAALEKDLAVTKLKALALNHRAQTVLILSEIISEYAQLTTIQQKHIDALVNENKTLEPVNRPVSNTPSPTAK